MLFYQLLCRIKKRNTEMDDFPWYIKARGKINLVTYVYKRVTEEDGRHSVSVFCPILLDLPKLAHKIVT